MRRIIVIAATGLSLSGCSSFSSLDVFKSAPPTTQLRLESVPQGADARTSVGPGCKTPCSVTVAIPENGLTVSYSLPRFLPATVPVQSVHVAGDFFSFGSTQLDPNPVTVELQPEPPPPKPIRKRVMRPKKRLKPAAAVAPADAPAAAGSPFPAPAPVQPMR